MRQMNTGKACVGFMLLLFGLMSCSTADRRLKKLTILDENYPHAFFFRAGIHAHEYDQWEKTYSNLMGIIGGVRGIEFFNRFKMNHPDQLVLIHLGGLGRDPESRPAKGAFFAGHWLYHNGAHILSDVPAEPGTTSIHVSDASLFLTDMTFRRRVFNDDIGLCELDESGMPDWSRSEQVKLISVDRKKNVINVKRGLYGTAPRAFSSKKSYAAAHCTSGPWGKNLKWFYNYARECPRDESGKNCIDVLLDDLSVRFSEDGDLAAFDGLEFDILYFDPLHLLNPRNTATNRGPDANADGKPDEGVIDGVNSYGIGTNDFLQGLRRRLGDDRLILADGNETHSQRSFGVLNGIESEGWPNGGDYHIEDWSGGLNRQFFSYENGAFPKFNFINHRYRYAFDFSKVEAHQVRLVMAASVLTNSAFALAEIPTRVLGTATYQGETPQEIRWALTSEGTHPVWDELIMGEEKRIGWLGKPLGLPVRLAEKEVPVLSAGTSFQFRDLIYSLDGPVEFQVEGEALKITTNHLDVKNLNFTLRDVSSYSSDQTIVITVRGEDMKGYPDNLSRLMHVSIPQSTGGLNRLMSWFNDRYFQAGFYFSHTPFLVGSPDIPVEVDLEFEFESTEPVWISEIQVYNHPDAMVREFEHGVVLANPSPRPYTFNLAELFPEKKFRRIKGSPKQDPETNDGSLVTENTIRLKGKDALFLIKE